MREKLVPVGFEPTPPERPRPERGALDHSARVPMAVRVSRDFLLELLKMYS